MGVKPTICMKKGVTLAAQRLVDSHVQKGMALDVWEENCMEGYGEWWLFKGRDSGTCWKGVVCAHLSDPHCPVEILCKPHT